MLHLCKCDKHLSSYCNTYITGLLHTWQQLWSYIKLCEESGVDSAYFLQNDPACCKEKQTHINNSGTFEGFLTCCKHTWQMLAHVWDAWLYKDLCSQMMVHAACLPNMHWCCIAAATNALIAWLCKWGWQLRTIIAVHIRTSMWFHRVLSHRTYHVSV